MPQLASPFPTAASRRRPPHRLPAFLTLPPETPYVCLTDPGHTTTHAGAAQEAYTCRPCAATGHRYPLVPLAAVTTCEHGHRYRTDYGRSECPTCWVHGGGSLD